MPVSDCFRVVPGDLHYRHRSYLVRLVKALCEKGFGDVLEDQADIDADF